MNKIVTWWRRQRDNAAAISTILGFAVLVGSMLVTGTIAGTAREAVYALFLGILAVVLLCTVLLQGRRVRCSYAICHIQDAVCRLVKENVADHHKREERLTVLRTVMDDVSTAFGILGMVKCRCCIKGISEQSTPDGVPDLWADTLCRNTWHVGDEQLHAIPDNTGFNVFFGEEPPEWFFGNDLPRLEAAGDYSNTTHNWKSRYKSTLIWPIRKLQSGNAARAPLAGFLCVDSKHRRPFDERDYSFGAIVADVLQGIVAPLLTESGEPD